MEPLPTTRNCDVIIVGLGPTGAVLANLLGQQGWSVVGVERDEDLYYAPRAVHFDDEMLTDLAISCAMWVGMGRMLRTLDIGQTCKITL